MNYNIEIETKSIYELGNNIEKEGNNYLTILDKFVKEVEQINECFDTKTGKILKEKLLEQLEKNKEMINNKYISYSKTINNIARIYDDVNEEIKKSIK